MAGVKKYNVPKRKAAIIFVFLTVIIDIFGTFLVIPIMANFAREIQGEPASCLLPDGTSMAPEMDPTCDADRQSVNANVGLMNNVFAAAALISSFWLPIVSDKYGRKVAFILSIGGSIFGFAAMAMSTNFEMLLVVRFIAGLFGGSPTVANAYIADVYPTKEQGGMFARLGVAIMCGVLFGPVLGGVLANIFGLRGPLYFATACSSLGMLCGLWYIVEPKELIFYEEEEGPISEQANPLLGVNNNAGSVELVVRESSKAVDVDQSPAKKENTKVKSNYNPWTSPFNLAIGMQTFLSTIAFNGVSSLMALLILEPKFGIVDPSDTIERQGQDAALVVGLTAGSISIAAIPSMIFLFGTLSKKIGLFLTGSIGNAIFGVALFIMPHTYSLGQLLGAMLLLGLANGLQSNVSTTSLSSRAPPDAVARTLAVGSTFDSAASIIGPLLTQLYRISPTAPYYVAAGCAWTGTCLLLAINATCGKLPSDAGDAAAQNDKDANDGDGDDSIANTVLGEPVFDREALTQAMFKGKTAGQEYSEEFAEELVDLMEELYKSYESNNHLQMFRFGVHDRRHKKGEINARIMTIHRELIQQHVPHMTKAKDDRDAFRREIQEMLIGLGHDDWAAEMPGAQHALERAQSIARAF
jgi:MFS family permease